MEWLSYLKVPLFIAIIILVEHNFKNIFLYSIGNSKGKQGLISILSSIIFYVGYILGAPVLFMYLTIGANAISRDKSTIINQVPLLDVACLIVVVLFFYIIRLNYKTKINKVQIEAYNKALLELSIHAQEPVNKEVLNLKYSQLKKDIYQPYQKE